MTKLREVAVVLKNIFSKPYYIFTALIISFFFYLLNGFITNIPNLNSAYTLFGAVGGTRFIFSLALNFLSSLSSYSAVFVIILSFLIGILISILIYRYKTFRTLENKKLGLFGSVGIFLGIVAPGCAACGVGLVSLLGLSSALVILPFKGSEVVTLATILIILSIINLSGKLYKPQCRLDLMKVKGGKNE
ncbi:hypothetical protein HY450_02870 [Candidatus Pacearchaeota archaeon]|nr:hypothetical protein [Candidatus Pacearchaeota archaeon]